MHSQELGDYIGAESCIDFTPNLADINASNGGAGTNRPPRQRRSDAAEKEYPPPLSSQRPWKYSTSDGRLVIRQEKVMRRHRYFQAHRSEGRLVLNLVPLDGAVEEICKEHAGAEGEEKLDFRENVGVSGQEIRDERINPMSKEVYSESNTCNVIGINPYGGFGVAVVGLMPPIHTLS